jgi:hypothetical protein
MSGRPATPFRLGRHEGGSDEQCPAPDQADGDVAFLATRTRCAVARRSPPVRRGSRRAYAGTRVHTLDLHDDRPALSVRELVTDEDLAVLVLVGRVAADLDRVLAPLEHLVIAGCADVLAHPHLRAGGAACAGAESATRPTAAMVVATLMDSSRRVADMSVVVVLVVMVYLAGVRQCGQRE